MHCGNVIEVINHYNSHKLVYYTQSINTDLVSEFYNNHRQAGDGHSSTTHVAKQDLDFTPTILQEFLVSSIRKFFCMLSILYSHFVNPLKIY